MWLAVTIVFIGLRLLPGDPIEAQFGQSGLSSAVIEARRAELGYDQPILIQYTQYISNLLSGDFGVSLISNQSIQEVLAQRLPSTIELGLSALVVAVIVGLSLGILSSIETPLYLPEIAQFLMQLALSVPIYWTATLVIFVITTRFGTSRLLIPAIVLGFHSAGGIARLVQSNLQEIRQASHVVTAYSKGLPYRLILKDHILRVGLLPIVTVIGLEAGFLLSGTVITEQVFNRNGIGKLLLEATLSQDYAVVQALVIVIAFIYTLFNQFTNVLHRLIDPPNCADNLMSFQRRFTIFFIFLLIIFLLAMRHDPLTTQPDEILLAPSIGHLLGTDHLGRDVFSRLIFGGIRTVGMGIGAVLITTIIGTLLGVLMTLNNHFDHVLRILLNSLLAFPSLITAFIVLTIIGRGIFAVAIGVGFALLPLYAFVVRSKLIEISSQHFVEVSYALGASRWHVYRKHLLPNSRQTLFSYAGVMFAYSLLNGAGLSFLGLGDDPSLPEWGVMLAEGRFAFRQAPWVALAPGICLSGLVFIVNRLVDRLNRFE